MPRLKIERIHSSKFAFLVFTLFASLSFTPSEHLECESLFPDENLELFGICRPSQKKDRGLELSSLISSPSTPSYLWGPSLPFETGFPDGINPPMKLAAVIRC